ncbi:MAG: NAD kinase [Marinifilaceae bacterium]
MKRVALFGKGFSPEYRDEVAQLFQLLRQNGCKVMCESNFSRYLCEEFDSCLLFDDLFDKSSFHSMRPDVLISVGGDGTFLDSIAYVRDSGVPIVGINLGRLGFLANIAVDEKEEAVTSLLNGEYEVEKRDVLAVTVDGEPAFDFSYALNEVSISKSDMASLLTVHASIDGDYLTSYWADGLVVATPTGSTAYSLSGGGPIVAPECPNFVLTPICPHNLNLRSLVVSNKVSIDLLVESRSGDFILGLDSRFCRLPQDKRVRIECGDFQVNTLKLRNHNYYRTLRNKMMWGEDRRNR